MTELFLIKKILDAMDRHGNEEASAAKVAIRAAKGMGLAANSVPVTMAAAYARYELRSLAVGVTPVSLAHWYMDYLKIKERVG
jgi:hypothetical protein